MTKVIILGENTPEQPKKPIEFTDYLTKSKGIQSENMVCPENYQNIELICKKYHNTFDLMFAYNESRSNGWLYLGHFNDGIV